MDREIWLDINGLFTFLFVVIPLAFAVSFLVSHLVDLVFE